MSDSNATISMVYSNSIAVHGMYVYIGRIDPDLVHQRMLLQDVSRWIMAIQAVVSSCITIPIDGIKCCQYSQYFPQRFFVYITLIGCVGRVHKPIFTLNINHSMYRWIYIQFYFWWKASCHQLRLVVYTIIYQVLYIQKVVGRLGFLVAINPRMDPYEPLRDSLDQTKQLGLQMLLGFCQHILDVAILSSKNHGRHEKPIRVGGFNPSEKYLSNWIIFPGRGENKMFETTTQHPW